MTEKHADPLLRKAIEALADAARRRVDGHPMGHLLQGRRQRLEIQVPIPLGPRDGAFDDAVREGGETLAAEIEALLVERAALRPGHVYCMRCGAADCEHSVPADARRIFAGYGASGLPRFQDFAQWLLERQHPGLDRVYQTPPRLVTEVISGRELTARLLPAFRDRGTEYHVHGQLTAGWFRIVRSDRTPAVLALSLQVVSCTVPRRGRRGARRRPRRRLTLNVLGRGPDGEPLEDLYARLGHVPWKPVVDWGQQVLQEIEGSQEQATPRALSRRVEGMLESMARRLEQGHRARERRTGHAEKRHHQGDRPTRMAYTDLARSRDECFLRDERRETMIVLGERGRAHVFNLEGKLVTSVRYSPESVERKLRREIWRPATAQETSGLRKKAGLGE